MDQELESLIGFTLRDVRAIKAVAIHYGDAVSNGYSDAEALWDALYTLIEKLEEDLEDSFQGRIPL